MTAIDPVSTTEARAEAAERKIAAVETLAKAWVGFDDSHHYGDAVLNALRDDAS